MTAAVGAVAVIGALTVSNNAMAYMRTSIQLKLKKQQRRALFGAHALKPLLWIEPGLRPVGNRNRRDFERRSSYNQCKSSSGRGWGLRNLVSTNRHWGAGKNQRASASTFLGSLKVCSEMNCPRPSLKERKAGVYLRSRPVFSVTDGDSHHGLT